MASYAWLEGIWHWNALIDWRVLHIESPYWGWWEFHEGCDRLLEPEDYE